MRWLIGIAIVLLLVVGLQPSTALAGGGSSGATAQAKGGNSAPTVDAVVLIESGSETQVTSMDPLIEYRVKATISDFNSIDDIAEVEFHIYHTSDGSQWDADEVGIFQWTESTGLWTMENGAAATTWSVNSGNSSWPTTTAATGDWYLAFTPGKLAQADAAQSWHASVTARDENKSGSGMTGTASAMTTYAEIGLSAATVDFGEIEPGQSGYIQVPASNSITSHVTANGDYTLAIRSDGTWDDGGSNTITLSGTTGMPATAAQFSLEADDQEAAAGNGQPKNPIAMTTGDTQVTTGLRVATSSQSPEGTGDTDAYMAVWMAESGIAEVTFSGTITFTVSN